jgi:hypothetical protein
MDVHTRMIGPRESVGPNKAKKQKDGSYKDGVFVEHDDRMQPVGGSGRAYSISLVNQAQSRMTAPAAAVKTASTAVDEHTALRSDILKYGSMAIMEGMRKGGPPGLVELLETQADATNLPRIGSDGNVAHPSFQVNISSAVEPEDLDEGASQIKSLGFYGDKHIDAKDSAAAPTGMANLSDDSDDIEEQLFYLFELGIAWILVPFCLYYFSGLHWHSGSQPVYKRNRADKDSIYYRITLIAYPPDDMLSGRDAVAFAGLPNNTTLKVGFDFRNP